MEVKPNVWAENPLQGIRCKCNRAFYTYVALDEEGSTTPSGRPPAEREQEQYEAAAKRRGIRLVRAGRKGLEDASSLKEDMLTALQHSTDAEA